MSSVHDRIDEIAECEFVGTDIAGKIATYADLTQRLAHDLARELANAERAAEAALRQLKGHPMLHGLDVRLRARKVTRVLREARELCQGISGEMVAFNVQFRHEFLEQLREPRSGKPSAYNGKVNL